MQREFVHYIPIGTTVMACVFMLILFRHWRRRPTALHLFWWMLGVATFAIGTLTESINTVFGWNAINFRAWYISGALFGGMPLAQGTVYLLLPRRTAHIVTAVVLAYVAVVSVLVMLTPLDVSKVEQFRLSGQVMEWTWVRAFSPLVNTYAMIFLVGGAFASAWRYYRHSGEVGSRVLGNVAIAVGALLPGIGGTFTRMGVVEALYVTEFIGVALIWYGYRLMVRDRAMSIHAAQRVVDSGNSSRT